MDPGGNVLAQVEALYDDNRFLDALGLARPAWGRAGWAAGASAEELVLACRLARRLGGEALGRWFFRQARRRFPDHPVVRTFGRWSFRRRRDVLGLLEDYCRRPRLESGEARWDASWLADSAYLWGIVRDFRQAHELLGQARAVGGDDVWADCMEGVVLLMEDRWAEAAESALRAWRSSPGKPAAAGVLARAMIRLGRVEEAIEELAPAADGQSYESLQLLISLLCAKAERSEGPLRRSLGLRAQGLGARLPGLAPLKDRVVSRDLAACRFDAAMLAGDAAAMRDQAAELPQPLFRRIERSLEHATDGAPTILPYRAVFQKRDACLPTSIAAIAGSFGSPIDAEDLARQITYQGTAPWRALDWLRGQGYLARPFVLSAALCREVLRRGLPFVYLIEFSLDASHATAAIGLAEATGEMIFHDPAAERFGRVLLDSLDETERPVGPIGLAFVPPAQAALLEAVPISASAPAETFCRFRKAMETRGLRAAREMIEGPLAADPDSDFLRALKSQCQAEAGEVYPAILELEALAGKYPQSVPVQRMLLTALQRTRDTARLMEVMEQIVRRGRLPGIREDQPWRYPPSSCVTQYADLLGLTAEGAGEGERLLRDLLGREPGSAMGYHVLGDICSRHGRSREAVLPYRLASLLSEGEEHLARAACDALHLDGQTEEGLAYLRGRVEQLGRLVHGAGPWMTLIDALEQYGRAEEAAATAEEAAAARPADADLHAHLTRFWLGMGRWEEARRGLEAVAGLGRRERHLEAAVHYYRAAGRWRQALDLCREWTAEAPQSMEARRLLLFLSRHQSDGQAEVDLSARWVARHRGDEDFENLHYEQLKEMFLRREAREFLLRRLQRNPRDVWAWRELAHWRLDEAGRLDEAEQGQAPAEFRKAQAEAERLAPLDAGTVLLKARLAEVEGRWKDCTEALLEAVRLAPEQEFAYGRTWEDCANLPAEDQERVLSGLEERLLRVVGHLHPARGLALGVAGRLGVERAEAMVQSWIERRPDDPELIEARVDLLLSHGQGRTDAARAAEVLEQAVRRFPSHFDLRISLASAYARLLRKQDQRGLLEASLRAQPLHGGVRTSLAALLVEDRQFEPAERLLQEGIDCNPQDSGLWARLADVQAEAGRPEDAVATLRRAVETWPRNIGLRHELLDRLTAAGRGPEAVALAREATDIFPDGAACRLMLGRALWHGFAHPEPGEAERALRKALDLNGALYDAADLLAVILANHRRFDEAEGVLRLIARRLPDASAARGRLAWVAWTRGEKGPAVREMVATIRAYPWYRWGWWQLMAWVEEDPEQYPEALDLMENVPPAVRHSPDLAARRLEVLQKAGLPRERLGAVWDQMMEDFPRDEDLLLRRFDMHKERKEWDQARQIIRRAEEFSDSLYLLARKVEMHAHHHEFRQATGTALAILERPGEDAPWPETVIWDILRRHQLVAEAAGIVLDALAAGRRVRRHGLRAMADALASLPAWTRVRCTGRRLSPGKALRRLAELLERCDWDQDGWCLGGVLEHLADRDRGSVSRFWRRNRDRCRRLTHLWQAIGYMLVTGKKPARARKWVADWRNRKDVGMVAVSYYLLSFGHKPPRRHWEDIRLACQDALARLSHDGTAQFLAARLCEALLRMGRTREFLEAAAAHEHLLQQSDERHWMPAYYAGVRMPHHLLNLLRLLRSTSPERAAEHFRRLRTPPRSPFLCRLGFRGLKKWFGFWRRLHLLVHASPCSSSELLP